MFANVDTSACVSSVGEKDCEHFESEPPKWVKDICENEEIKEKLKRISELKPTKEQEVAKHG